MTRNGAPTRASPPHSTIWSENTATRFCHSSWRHHRLPGRRHLPSLAREVAPFGVHVTLIEPAGFDTDWSESSSRRAEELPAYADVHAATEKVRKTRWAAPGDPKASAAAVLKIVDAELAQG